MELGTQLNLCWGPFVPFFSRLVLTGASINRNNDSSYTYIYIFKVSKHRTREEMWHGEKAEQGKKKNHRPQNHKMPQPILYYYIFLLYIYSVEICILTIVIIIMIYIYLSLLSWLFYMQCIEYKHICHIIAILLLLLYFVSILSWTVWLFCRHWRFCLRLLEYCIWSSYFSLSLCVRAIVSDEITLHHWTTAAVAAAMWFFLALQFFHSFSQFSFSFFFLFFISQNVAIAAHTRSLCTDFSPYSLAAILSSSSFSAQI